MVSNELSKAIRELESTFNKKIENILSGNRNSFFESKRDSIPRKFEASDSVKVISTDDAGKVNFFSWLRNSFFRK